MYHVIEYLLFFFWGGGKGGKFLVKIYIKGSIYILNKCTYFFLRFAA